LLAGLGFLTGLALLAGCAKPLPPSIPAEAWASPNLLVNRAGIDAIKERLRRGEPVTVAAYDDLVRVADELMKTEPNPIVGELKIPAFYTAEQAEQQRIVRRLRTDARAAHALALARALTGKAEYGAKAKDFVFGWVASLTKPVDGGHWWQAYKLEQRGDTPLAVAYSFPAFIFAFDLLKGEGALSPEEIQSFRDWLRPYVAYCRSEEWYKNNHHNWQVVFLMCAAHALEDADLFDLAVRYYRHGVSGQIRWDGALPRELWRREKSGTYTLMALEGMIQAVHIAERHGYEDLRELRSKEGGTLERALDFYVRYLEAPQEWIKYTNAKTLNAPADPSDWGYIFELPYRWWGTPAYQAHMQKRPYGFGVERCYTLDFATLLFAGG
jgi:hypothetical protein